MLLQHSHTHGPDEVCPTCGQVLPPAGLSPRYGDNKPNRTGLAIAIGLHLLILVLALLNPQTIVKLNPPSKAGEMVWIAPVTPTPTPPKPQPQPAPEKPSPQRQPKVAQAKPRPAPPPIKRTNNDAITDPVRQETPPPPVKADMTPPPPDVTDMSQMVEAARRRRGAVETPATESAESADAKAKARAVANIMGAQGRNSAGEREDSGGIFDVQNQTFNSADLKFRGWNTNFKRRWLSQVKVELGNEIDIENAVVTKMIELIRKEKPGDFEWESHRLGRVVKMSARKEDEAELRAFLLREMYPRYIRPAGR
ncbi:hypothetical protein FCL38_22785 [Pseudoduganella umbonata]|uniref:Energy transducer TonB n=1 Tax=Pseudoduganella umbonata TaxID=864828 RepID=A0ABX5UX57_9BURK|nr:hypothetical protein FCL38_22785 [Pseudoduganella umbonata]